MSRKLTNEENNSLPRIRVLKTHKARIDKQVKKQGVRQYEISSRVVEAGLKALGY